MFSIWIMTSPTMKKKRGIRNGVLMRISVGIGRGLSSQSMISFRDFCAVLMCDSHSCAANLTTCTVTWNTLPEVKSPFRSILILSNLISEPDILSRLHSHTRYRGIRRVDDRLRSVAVPVAAISDERSATGWPAMLLWD